MPGSYAHMVLVNKAGEPESMIGFPAEAAYSVPKHMKYCELGAVSPDYPYLAGAGEWADLMHYTRTGEMIRAGVRALCALPKNARGREYAWLMGYAAHVVADVTIHPVVFKIVGDYDNHKEEHRWCEMNQDVHVFRRMNVGEVGKHLKSGIRACKVDGDASSPGIAALWRTMLKEVYPDDFAAGEPDFGKWHTNFGRFLDIADSGPGMPSFSRHIANALTPAFYPPIDEVEKKFIEGLETPDGAKMHYDEVYDLARDNVRSLWLRIALAVEADEPDADLMVCAWNLDTGEEPDGTKTHWRKMA